MSVHDTSPVHDDMSLLDMALVLAENMKLLVLVPLAAGLFAVIVVFLLPHTFTATTRILPPQQQSATASLAAHLGAFAGLIGSTGSIKSPSDQLVALLKSRTVADAIIQRFDLMKLYEARYLEDARKELHGNTTITAGTRDGIVSIEVEDSDPHRAASIANAFVEELGNLTSSLAVTEAAQRRLFFDKQLKQAKHNLTQAEITLRSSGVNEATLKTVPQATLEIIARLRAQITAQEIKLASMRTFMTDANAETRLAAQELSALRAELAKTEQSNVVKAASEGADYIARFRDFKYHEALFELIARQYELARLDEAREGNLIQVLDVAYPPERRSSPKRTLIVALTAATALLFVVAFILGRQALRDAVRRPETSRKLQRLKKITKSSQD